MNRLWPGDGIYIVIAMVIMLLGFYKLWQAPDWQVTEQVLEPVSELPDFASIADVKEKKSTFFQFLLPKIQTANQQEKNRRAFLANIDFDNLSSSDEAQLYALAKRYRVQVKGLSAQELKIALLPRVDIVPAALILAQGANESAWGTSRFARDGNNLFGLWCFTHGCGLKPLQRNSDAKHEVERFRTVQDGVNKYVKTINSHPAYLELRNIRESLRNSGKPLSGVALAAGLTSYSERGQDYIDEIQAMIRFNELEKFNQD